METIGFSERIVRSWLEKAQIEIDGPDEWAMRIRNKRAFPAIVFGGSLGLGESYMRGDWDCECLDGFFFQFFSAGLERYRWASPATYWDLFTRTLLDSFSVSASRAFDVADVHYDLGNDLFELMLGESMVYTCAYWGAGATTLAQAQEAKLHMVCRKLGLRPGDRVLDIGCGWGSFARFAARHYGVSVVGITVSDEQARYAGCLCAGLPVEILVQDYRNMDAGDTFDHVVSLGMFEHVQKQNYRIFFNVVRHCLKPGGNFLLHTIGRFDRGLATDPWLNRYIFPNSMLPARGEIAAASNRYLQIVDWHELGPENYDKTLMAWYRNFAKHWSRLERLYGFYHAGHFRRMWQYYLLCCAGAFRSGDMWDVWQIKMTHY